MIDEGKTPKVGGMEFLELNLFKFKAMPNLSEICLSFNIYKSSEVARFVFK